MRTIFMGTDIFAVPALKAVIYSDVELLCVITQPDRPRGRGLKTGLSPVKEIALENNLPLYQPKRVRDREFIDEVLKPLVPDVFVVVAFGQILPKEVLELPHLGAQASCLHHLGAQASCLHHPVGCINLHPSLLPKLRGAAPIQHAIINGEKETGATVMFMDEGEDTGDIILQDRMEIDVSDTAEILSQKLAELGARLIQRVLQLAQSGSLPRHPQDNGKATHAPKLKKEDGLIDWNRSALEIHNLIRGTIPWPGAYTTFRETMQLKIWGSQPLGESVFGTPGTITDVLPDQGIVVATGDMGLVITTVQPANKSRIAARDFANGYRAKAGDVFS